MDFKQLMECIKGSPHNLANYKMGKCGICLEKDPSLFVDIPNYFIGSRCKECYSKTECGLFNRELTVKEYFTLKIHGLI